MWLRKFGELFDGQMDLALKGAAFFFFGFLSTFLPVLWSCWKHRRTASRRQRAVCSRASALSGGNAAAPSCAFGLAGVMLDVSQAGGEPGSGWRGLARCWVAGAPRARQDGGLAIVELHPDALVDGRGHGGLPIIVSRVASGLAVAGGQRALRYADVARHIDLAGDAA